MGQLAVANEFVNTNGHCALTLFNLLLGLLMFFILRKGKISSYFNRFKIFHAALPRLALSFKNISGRLSQNSA
jgi:hypothetical protein